LVALALELVAVPVALLAGQLVEVVKVALELQRLVLELEELLARQQRVRRELVNLESWAQPAHLTWLAQSVVLNLALELEEFPV
jgi:hypothetical protein